MTSGARVPSLKGRALRYLAAREHSRAELQAKLARHVTCEDEPGALTRVLDELAAKGFINEARVTESLLHRRAGRLGQARVLQELRAKGLPDEIMADAAVEILSRPEYVGADAAVIANSMTGSGNSMRSRITALFGSHSVSPVRVSFRPARATMSPA